MKTSPHRYKHTIAAEAQRNSATCKLATCRALYVAAIAGLLSLCTHSARAVNWIGGVDGAWEDVTNWDSDPSLPSSTDVAVFAGTESAIVSDTQTVGRVNIGSSSTSGDSSLTITSTGSLTLNTNGSTYKLRQIWGGSGGTGDSTVTVDGGTLVAGDGVQTGGDATDQDAFFNVLNGGTATIGSTFNYTSSSGGGRTVVVDGAGSSLTVNGETLLNGSTPGTLTISNGGTFTTESGTITGVVAGAGGTFVQDGVGGTTTLSGENTFTGDYTVTNGTLAIGGSGKIGNYTGNITVATGAIFEYSSDQSGSASNRIQGSISGDGKFVVDAGTGSMISRGAVSVPTIEIKSGTLIQQANDSSLGSAGTTVYLGDTEGAANAAIEYSGAAGERTQKTGIIVQAGSTGTKTLTGITNAVDNTDITLNDNLILAPIQHDNNDRFLTFGGVISGTGGLIVEGVANGAGDAGVVVLSNADNNTYTGATVVNSGILVEQVSAAVNGGDWTRTTSATTVNDGATLRLDTTNQTNAGSKQAIGTITVNAGGTLELLTVATAGNQPSIWQNGGASTLLGEGTLVKNGTGLQGVAWSGSGASNLDGFNGDIQINAGRLIFDPGNTGSVGSGNNDVTVAAGAELDVRSGTLLIDSLDGVGTVINTAGNGSNTLSIGNNDGDGTFSGVITQTDADAFSLVKNGSGTQTLSGANTHNGGTTLNAGTLVLSNAEAAGTGTISQADDTSTLRFDTTGTITNDMSLYKVESLQDVTMSGNITANNTAYVIADGTTAALSGVVSGSGAIVKNGSGSMTLSGVNTHTGGTTLNAGTLVLSDAAAAGTGTLTLAGGTLQTSALSHANAISATAGTTTNVEVFQSEFTGALTGSGTINFIGSSSVGADQSRIMNTDLSGFSGTIVHDNTAANRFNIWNTTNTDNVKIVTTGDTSTDYTGIRFLGGNYTISELSGDGGRIHGRDNTLTVNQSTDTTYSGVLAEDSSSLTLSLVKDGSGSLTLDAANTYTGTTTVSGGTLSLASGYTHSGSGAYTVGTDGTSATLKIAHGINLSDHAVSIGNGGIISPGNSPGTASTGSQTWNDGGSYLWEINDSDGTKGGTTGWDWLDITGTLDLSNLTTGGFTIDINSLNSLDLAGTADGFDTYTKNDGFADYSFIIASTTLGITSFDESDFVLDFTGFSNAPGWDWSIQLSGNDLVLEAYAVPEPSSAVLLGLGGLALALRRKRS